MLSESRDCSNTLLWTNEIQMRHFQVNQTFTVYPLIDGPLRTEIQKNYHLHWAIIIFTDGPSTTKCAGLHEEDERLMMAIHNVISMGYHVAVWTYLDDDDWGADLELAGLELAQTLSEQETRRTQSRTLSRFLDPQHIERRERYEVFVRHGIAGFLQADLNIFDELRTRIAQAERQARELAQGVDHSTKVELAQLPQAPSQNSAGPELMGFLEHTEESIVEVD